MGDGTVYVLNQVNGQVGFYKLKAGNTLSEGKAYLLASDSQSGVKLFEESDVPTGIVGIEHDEDVKTGGVVYNLAGQRVTTPGKGIYIINGKKVLFK